MSRIEVVCFGLSYGCVPEIVLDEILVDHPTMYGMVLLSSVHR